MRYRNYLALSLLFLIPLCVFGQMPVVKHESIGIKVGENIYPLKSEQTQTQLNGGWNVVGWQVGKRCTRYFWGKQSNQLSENKLPVFVISPYGQTLSDFVIIKLKQKKQYRRLPQPALSDNEFQRIDLQNFHIKVLADESFEVQPKQSLSPGEYIIMDSSQTPIGDLQDYQGYTFSVPL